MQNIAIFNLFTYITPCSNHRSLDIVTIVCDGCGEAKFISCIEGIIRLIL